MASSVGKRQRERQKVERARAKAERKTARQTTDEASPEDLPLRSETELMEDLQTLQRSFENDELSLEEFEERRDLIQAQFEQLSK